MTEMITTIEALLVKLRRELVTRDLEILKLKRVRTAASDVLAKARKGLIDEKALARLEDAIFDSNQRPEGHAEVPEEVRDSAVVVPSQEGET